MKRITAFVLTWIAGFVDAIGFLHYGQVYTANMSGNSVALGINEVSNSALAFRHGWPIVFFLIGLLTGRLFLEVGFRRQIRSVASVVFALEIGLAVVAVASSQWVAVAALALAMGLQNAAFTRFGSLQVHTGFVAGTLLKATEYAVQYATWLHDRTIGGRLGRMWLALTALLAAAQLPADVRIATALGSLRSWGDRGSHDGAPLLGSGTRDPLRVVSCADRGGSAQTP